MLNIHKYGKMFGTDGIRGKVNQWPMTAEIALKVAMAAGKIFMGKGGSKLHRVVIGKDTRLSGYMFEPSLVAGFTSIGMDCLTLGPVPTPGVSRLTRSFRADLGVMISASHNSFADNGIKIFGPDGFKLSDEIEMKISKMVAKPIDLALPENLGRVKRLEDAGGRYIEVVKSCLPRGQRLEGLKVVLDCANGAGYKVAPQTLFELGAEVIPISVSPDGFNINENCGAVYPEKMATAVKAHRADVGIAFDGDADRLIMCDEKGSIINGDQILAVLANRMKSENKLNNSTVVGTIMSNYGLQLWLEKIGIKFLRTSVGDRFISEEIHNKELSLGGEPSGHILIPSLSLTGDALLNSLMMLIELVKENKPASKVFNKFIAIPQTLKNISNVDKTLLKDFKIINEIDNIQNKVMNNCRLVVRESGTEPVVRIMAESNDRKLINFAINEIENLLKKNS